MIRRNTITVVLVLVALTALLAACGNNRRNQQTPTDTPAPAVEVATEAAAAVAEVGATAEEVATDVPEAEATTEETAVDTVEGAATAVPEAEATAEQSAEGVATEVTADAVVADEASSEAAAMVHPPIQIESEASIVDVINNNNPYMVTLSSKGERLAWPQSEGRLWKRKGELCTYTFESAASNCVVAPDTYEGYPYAFPWSPDDGYIAFTENPFQLGYESDIWVYKTESGEFVDLTDDGVVGDWATAEAGSYALDYLPMWNQQDGQIYFWRSIPDPAEPISMSLSIMKIAPELGEAELVRDVQSDMGGDLIMFNDEQWYMDGVSALSPDGRFVAVLTISAVQTETNDSDGLWIVDLEDTSVPPRQVATADDFNTANLPWTGIPLYPSGLSWQASGDHLVVLAQNNDTQVPVVVLYYVDVASGELTPVVDFSNLTEENEYMNAPDDKGLPLRFYSPWTATMSPDNQQLLMYQNLAGVAGLMESPLPPTGDLPAVVFESSFQDLDATSRSSRGDNGKVLIYNVLFNTNQQQ